MEELQLILIVLFTIVYLIVTVIQQNQIKALKSHNEMLSGLLPIFDLKKFKEAASIEKEIAEMQIKKMMLKFEVDEEFINDILKPHIKKFEDTVEKQVNEEFAELMLFATTVISGTKKELRKEIVNRYLPKTASYFDALLEADKKDS